MSYDTRFLKIVFWETVENLPLFIGFLLAVKFRIENLTLAFIFLIVGTALGAGLIHFTESKKFSNQPTLKETLINFGVFTALAIPFVFYFSAADVWWSTWYTDIVLGVVSGIVLAIAESWGWSHANISTVRTHAVSMAVAAIAVLIGIRMLYGSSLGIALIVGLVLTFVVSVIISRIDYWPIKDSVQHPTRQNPDSLI